MKRFLFLLSILCAAQGMMAQLTSLGMIEETSIENAINKGLVSRVYRPQMTVIDEHLYIATVRGLYRHDVDDTATTEWEKMEVTDDVIYGFCVHNDTLLVLTEKMLYISTDDGKNTIKVLVDSIVKEKPYAKLLDMAVHPNNACNIFIAHEGLSRTTDGGKTWETVNTDIGDMIFPFDGICYNPHANYQLIGYYNQEVIDECQLLISNDNGDSWTQTRGLGSPRSCFDIVFHPADEKRMIVYGSSLYAISENGGESWVPQYAENNHSMAIDAWNIIYDNTNPEVLYSATIRGVHKSVDGGTTWSYFYGEDLGEVRSLAIYKDLLFIYTRGNGIYMLDLVALSETGKGQGGTLVMPAIEKETLDIPYYDLQGRPVSNPERGIYIKDGKKVIIGQ